MYLKIDNYTDFELNINRTDKTNKNCYNKWCEISLRIENEYFKYKTTNNELLLESEVETLIVELDKLLKGELVEEKHIDFLEPDLEFTLIPINNEDSGLVNIKINLFQNGELSADYYNLCIDTEEIEKLLIYLNTVIPTIKLYESKQKYINTETDNYCVVSVKYCDYDGDKVYDYILSKEINSTNVGDKVLVDRAGNEVLAKIVSKNFYNENNAPYPIGMTKEVIEIVKDDIYSEKEKSPKCPNCNNDLVDILYGFPIGEAFKQAEEKKNYLGGCCKLGEDEQPTYHCYKCNRSYFSDLKEYIETKKFYEKIKTPENIISEGENE